MDSRVKAVVRGVLTTRYSKDDEGHYSEASAMYP